MFFNFSIKIVTEMMSDTESNFTFGKCQQNLKSLKLPSNCWCTIHGNDNFFAFVRTGDDANFQRKVVVSKNFSVKLFFNEKLNPLSNFITIQSEEQISKLLQTLDEME